MTRYDRAMPPDASAGSMTSAAPSSRTDLVGIVLIVISACAFGSGALFAKSINGAGVDWLTLLAWRFLIAAVASWLWLVARRSHRVALRGLSRRQGLVLLALGVLYVGNSSTYFAALDFGVPASLAALVVYIYPALVAVLSLRFGRRLEGRRAWLALAIASAGVALSLGGIRADAMPPALGIQLAIASPLIYAVWIILAARLGGERPDRDRGIPPQDSETTTDPASTPPAPAAALMTTATCVVFWLIAVTAGRPVAFADIPGAAWPGLIGVGLVSTALSIQAFYAGSRRIGAANASLISTVEPVYTITLATLLFAETLTPVQLLGGLMVIGGVILAQTARPAAQEVATTPASAASGTPAHTEGAG
ncbi:MAG: DMT family transporter [Candidatus Limnocylindrales bacterium]